MIIAEIDLSAEDDDIGLDMFFEVEDHSEAQLATYEKAAKEHADIKEKLNEVIGHTTSQNVFLGDIFSAYRVSGKPDAALETIAKPVAEVRKELKQVTATNRKYQREASKRAALKTAAVAMDLAADESEEDIPLSKRGTRGVAKAAEKVSEKTKPIESPKTTKRKSIPEKPTPPTPPKPAPNVRPSEASSTGGLSVGVIKKKDIVDLTRDDGSDAREINFSKIQGKTFPSLIVVARPYLRLQENATVERQALDAKVKGVLMATATKFTEWLIQQGLVRSEQICVYHPGTKLKLGMYSDATKFPYSGGYVWISECCPSRFVSVFNNSIFEGAPQPPAVLLKLIYHWSCQTTVQNVILWVKTDSLYVKSFFTWLRAVCSLAINENFAKMGGPGKKIEIGIISLGTSNQDGNQKQVKVEVIGVLDPVEKTIRLRAVEPIVEEEKIAKRRFQKILEPLGNWVHKSSHIQMDTTIDKAHLLTMGFTNISEAGGNTHVMDYLRRIVPRMFANALSLLSRPIIQQFLDELVWRESYGSHPAFAFDNIVAHIAQQTKPDNKDTLVSRLDRVAANPFNVNVLAERDGESSSKSRKRPLSPAPPVVASKTPKIKEDPKKVKKDVKTPVKPAPIEKKVEQICLETFYYGTLPAVNRNQFGASVKDFKVKCSNCKKIFKSNVELMNHLKKHILRNSAPQSCIYCLHFVNTPEALKKHHAALHATQTKMNGMFGCLLCETRVSTQNGLMAHMQKSHVAFEMPYHCGACDYASSSHRGVIDHFHAEHKDSGSLMCPVCFKMFLVNGSVLQEQLILKKYIKHLKAHRKEVNNRRCNKCVLRYINRGALTLHKLYDHTSHIKEGAKVKPLQLEGFHSKTMIGKPRHKTAPDASKPFKVIEKLDKLLIRALPGTICTECDYDFDEDLHLFGKLKCKLCAFTTCCTRKMLDHCSQCKGPTSKVVTSKTASDTPVEMHCVCGFSSTEMAAVANHLKICEGSTVYSTADGAQSNLVMDNVLDFLGLVPNAEHSTADAQKPQDGADKGATDEQQSKEPAETTDGDTTAVVSEPSKEPEETTDGDATAAVVAEQSKQQEPVTDAGDMQFDTQLSLDDLAPPSVPPNLDSGMDRTPQLTNYESLETPRFPQPMDTGEYDADGGQLPQSFE